MIQSHFLHILNELFCFEGLMRIFHLSKSLLYSIFMWNSIAKRFSQLVGTLSGYNIQGVLNLTEIAVGESQAIHLMAV